MDDCTDERPSIGLCSRDTTVISSVIAMRLASTETSRALIIERVALGVNERTTITRNRLLSRLF